MGDISEVSLTNFIFQCFTLGDVLSIFGKAQTTWRVLRVDNTLRANRLGQNEGVITTGGLQVGHRHAGVDAEEIENLHRFPDFVTHIVDNVSIRPGDGAPQGLLVQCLGSKQEWGN